MFIPSFIHYIQIIIIIDMFDCSLRGLYTAQEVVKSDHGKSTSRSEAFVGMCLILTDSMRHRNLIERLSQIDVLYHT